MKYALLGFPLGHSLSPFIHKELFFLSGKTYDYCKMEINHENLSKNLFKNLSGFNVTIPYKVAIIPLLDELSSDAKDLGSVNTVKHDYNKFIGYNTDYFGFLTALKISEIELKGHVTITGYGGTSRMMCHAAARNGCKISLSVRDKSKIKGEELVLQLKSAYKNLDIKVETPDRCDIVLNATPAGMYPNINSIAVPKKLVENSVAVFDAVYNPKETLLVKTAKSAGVKAASGMVMLVSQAAASHKIWYGAEFSQKELKEITILTNNELERSFKA